MSFERQYTDRIIPAVEKMEFTDRQTSSYIPEHAPIGRELPEKTPVAVITRKLASGLMVAASLVKLGEEYDVSLSPWGFQSTMRFPATEKYVKNRPDFFGRLDLYSLRKRDHGEVLASLSFSLGSEIAARNDDETRLIVATQNEIDQREKGAKPDFSLITHDPDLDSEWQVTPDTLSSTPLSILKADVRAKKAQDFGMHHAELCINAGKAIWHELDRTLPERGLGHKVLLDPVARACFEGLIRQRFGLPITSTQEARHQYSGPRDARLVQVALTTAELDDIFKTNFMRKTLNEAGS